MSFWLQDDESETADETLAASDDKPVPHELKDSVNVVSSTNHKSKKKKKKKSKESSFPSTNKVEKPFDEILETLSLELNSYSDQPANGKSKLKNTRTQDSLVKRCTPSILQVDPKYLNADNELRRIFGSKVVNSFEKSNQTGSSRQTRSGRRAGHNPRKTILVSPSENWPRWDGSFYMEFLEVRDGYQYFR